MFDITKSAVVDTATLHVKDASGQPLYADVERTKPVEIVIYGPGSPQAAAVESRQTSRALKRMTDNDNKMTAPTAEERIRETAEDLAAITREFRNFSYSPADGAQGTALFEAVYSDRKLGFIVNQVQKFFGDWGNFRPAQNAG